jgi:hypothetical protein
MKSHNHPLRGTARAMILGALSFAVVSVLGFAVWAVGGRWLHARVGEIGLFAACLIVFLGASGLLMHPLVSGSNRLLRFYSAFIPAFFTYATVWSLSWFVFHFGLGEWLASLLGSVAFVAAASWRLGGRGSFLKACAVVFISHSAGYFLGGKLMTSMGGLGGTAGGFSKEQVALLAKLGWGILYGLGFGAGIGYTFSAFREPVELTANAATSRASHELEP